MSDTVEVLDATVEYWHHSRGGAYANSAKAKLLVDELPPHDSFIYEERDKYFFAKSRGICRFYSNHNPGEGFAGRHFNLTMIDGSEVTLKGPWSGNSMGANKRGWPLCREVSITDDPEVWERGYTFSASVVTLPVLQRAILIASHKYVLDSPHRKKYGSDEPVQMNNFGFALSIIDWGGPFIDIIEVKDRRLWGAVFELAETHPDQDQGRRYHAPDLAPEQIHIVGGW